MPSRPFLAALGGGWTATAPLFVGIGGGAASRAGEVMTTSSSVDSSTFMCCRADEADWKPTAGPRLVECLAFAEAMR